MLFVRILIGLVFDVLQRAFVAVDARPTSPTLRGKDAFLSFVGTLQLI